MCKDELTRLVYQSPENYKKLKVLLNQIVGILSSDSHKAYHELDRASQIKFGYQFMNGLMKLNLLDMNTEQAPTEINYVLDFEIPASVSEVMVKPLLKILFTPQQVEKWIKMMNTGYVFGAYAQTELGHGSDVQSLETEAVYDKVRKEFVINSPTLSSFKWWPGELTNLASIAIVFAKTILGGKKAAVLPFIVQIRDLETHQPMPGVEIGDIGPKMGYAAKENGFLKFTNVRIPLENMPMRYWEINPEGVLIKKGNPKIIYSSMMKTRTVLLEISSFYLGKGVAIALRYSFFRRQFKGDNKEEIPVIQYQLQQARLFGFLAKAYAMRCSFNVVLELINSCNREIENNDFKNLQEIHIILSGSKCWFTNWCVSGLVMCANCCGGHGASKFSGITQMIETFIPNTILEGENAMLSLQMGAFLLKCMKYLNEGKPEKLTGYCKYLCDFETLLDFNSAFDQDLLDPNSMLKIWRKSVAAKLSQIGLRVIEEMGQHSIRHFVNTKIGLSLFEVSKLHTILLTFDFFLQYNQSVKHEGTRLVFGRLARVFISEQVFENARTLLGLDVVSQQQMSALRKNMLKDVEALYQDCITLTDPFIFDERTNLSQIARENEKPYDNLYQTAKQIAILNKTDLTSFYLDTIRKSSIETFGQPKL